LSAVWTYRQRTPLAINSPEVMLSLSRLPSPAARALRGTTKTGWCS